MCVTVCLEEPPQLNWEKVWEHQRSVAGSAIGSKSHVLFADDALQSEEGSARKRMHHHGPGSGASSVGSKSLIEDIAEVSIQYYRTKARSGGGSVKSKSECSSGHDFVEMKDTKQVLELFALTSSRLPLSHFSNLASKLISSKNTSADSSCSLMPRTA